VIRTHDFLQFEAGLDSRRASLRFRSWRQFRSFSNQKNKQTRGPPALSCNFAWRDSSELSAERLGEKQTGVSSVGGKKSLL